jgi:hypothetical protein
MGEVGSCWEGDMTELLVDGVARLPVASRLVMMKGAVAFLTEAAVFEGVFLGVGVVFMGSWDKDVVFPSSDEALVEECV